MRARKILFAGGGTGGHVLPLVAVAREIKKISPETKIYFVGPEEFPLDCLRVEGVEIKKIIAAGKIRRYFSLLYLWEIIKLPLAFIQALIKVALINPNVVLGKGSYGSVLPVVAARMLGKKVILHESDVIPGMANRFLSKFTDNISVAFEESKKYFRGENIRVVGNPVRLKYAGLSKAEAEAILGFSPRAKTIFVSGGSQGAQKINQVIMDSLPILLESYIFIWSIGGNNFEAVKSKAIRNSNLKIYSLLSEKELAAAYVLSGLIIGRAGAGTIFESAAFAKPAILIPLGQAGGHQIKNAQIYADAGAAVMLQESALNKDVLIKTINDLAANSQLLSVMSQNAKKFAKIEAGKRIAQILLDLPTG